MNLFMFLFPSDPVFSLTPLHLLSSFILTPISHFLSSHPFLLSLCYFIGCRISRQRGDRTETAPGAAGWNLCYKVWLPAESALHAADAQQRHPRADCSARYQQSQCWFGSHCWPDSLHWVLQVGGALVTPLGGDWRYFISRVCGWSKHAPPNGTRSDPDQTQSRWDFIDLPVEHGPEKLFFLIAK